MTQVKSIYQRGLRYCSTCRRATAEIGFCSECHRKLRTTPKHHTHNKRKQEHQMTIVITCSDCKREFQKIYNRKNMLCARCYHRRYWHIHKVNSEIPKPVSETTASRIHTIFAVRLIN